MARTTTGQAPTGATGVTAAEGVNEVRIVGRVSAVPEQRTMPSGDELVSLRVVVARPPTGPRRRHPVAEDQPPVRAVTVDTIDVACWAAGVRRRAARLAPGDVVEVEGALRRRFYRAGAVALSRYEVEASSVRKR